MLTKNHSHAELPHQNHIGDLSDVDIQDAVEFYADEGLNDVPIATKADLEHAWGEVLPAELNARELVDLDTNDKAILEALEAKEQKEAAKKKFPSKSTSSKLSKIQKQLKKDKNAKASGSTNDSAQPSTPPAPPPNQLQDIDKTPGKCKL